MTAAASDASLSRGQAALRAALWSCGTLASLTIMAVAGREAAKLVPSAQVVLHRGWIGAVIVVLIAIISGMSLRRLVATDRLGRHAWRNACHFTAQWLWFWSLTQIPLADVFALEMTIPLWLAVFAPILLGEKLTLARIAALIIGFAGVLIVLRPAGSGISPGAVSALGCAVFFALSIVSVKQLVRTDGPLTLLFWMCTLQTLYGVMAGWSHLAMPPVHAMGWLVVVAMCGLGTHYCQARAMALADTLTVAPMDFLRLPLIAVVGLIVYQERLDLWVLLGGAIIAFGNILNIFGEQRRRPA